MALNTIADLSNTPASNTDLLGQSTSGTQSVSSLDNMIRNHAAIMARAYLDQGGVVTVGGSANAITVTSNSTYQSLTNGLTISFKAASANTGATTLNLDSLGAKAVRRQGDSALSANDILANGTYRVRYDTAYNGAAGAWVLLNPGLPTVVSSLGALANSSGVLTNDGSGGLSWAAAAQSITLGTPQSPSGVAQVDYTSIPSTAKQIVVAWQGLSSASNSAFGLQIGPSGGIETTGYNQAHIAAGSGVGSGVVSAGANWNIGSASAANSHSGVAILTLLDSSANTWSVIFNSGASVGTSATTDTFFSASGFKSLAGALTRLRVISGTGNFDAGKVNIAYT